MCTDQYNAAHRQDTLRSDKAFVLIDNIFGAPAKSRLWMTEMFVCSPAWRYTNGEKVLNCPEAVDKMYDTLVNSAFNVRIHIVHRIFNRHSAGLNSILRLIWNFVRLKSRRKRGGNIINRFRTLLFFVCVNPFPKMSSVVFGVCHCLACPLIRSPMRAQETATSWL